MQRLELAVPSLQRKVLGSQSVVLLLQCDKTIVWEHRVLANLAVAAVLPIDTIKANVPILNTTATNVATGCQSAQLLLNSSQ